MFNLNISLINCRFSLLLLVGTILSVHAQQEIDIVRIADPTKRIPVSLEGYSGEVNSVLQFDLSVQGFKLVKKDQAYFVITGKNTTRVEGRVVDANGNEVVSPRYYQNKSLRRQAHAWADDIVESLWALAGVETEGISKYRIAFKQSRQTGRSEIGISDFDGHSFYQITGDKSLVAAPTWAVGSRHLYYTSYYRNNPDIYLHDLSTGKRREIARYPGLNTAPAVSPSGAKIAMILSKGGSPDLYVANADGSNLARLTKTKAIESSPCWSPDGKTLCYVSNKDGAARLYTIPAKGGSPSRLRTTGIVTGYEPDWSPDGKQIAFTTSRGGGRFGICIVPATGGVAEELVQGEDPSWAPNSRTIVFTKRSRTGRSLSLLDAPSKHVKDVSKLSGSCSQPTWSK